MTGGMRDMARAVSLALAVCLLSAAVPGARAEEPAAQPAATDTTAAAPVPAPATGDTVAATDTVAAPAPPQQVPASGTAGSRLTRRVVLAAGGLIIFGALVAIGSLVTASRSIVH